jgi:hypothetical protein
MKGKNDIHASKIGKKLHGKDRQRKSIKRVLKELKSRSKEKLITFKIENLSQLPYKNGI